MVLPPMRTQLVSASPTVGLHFLAWPVEYIRHPRRTWWEATGGRAEGVWVVCCARESDVHTTAGQLSPCGTHGRRMTS
jgi:hypothetical protein